MKFSLPLSAAILLSMPVTSSIIGRTGHGPAPATTFASANGAQSADIAQDEDNSLAGRENPCAAPNEITGPIAETAWRIWVAAACPVNQNEYPFVVWENWLEQAQMYPLNPAKVLKVPNSLAKTTASPRLLHASPLALVKNPGLGITVPGLLGGADQNCNAASIPPKDQPKLVICEEVREGGSTEDYIAGTNIWNRRGQMQLASTRGEIQFPKSSVEIKADWIELSSIGLSCDTLPPGFRNSIHVEMINGNCFALAGMHLISKLLDKWIWATFEPQNSITNPNRCKVLGCRDVFGSMPVTTKGASTQLTPQLDSLMTAAHLAPEWKNYRLDAVQIHFVGEGGNPTLLGNSIIEGENAGVPLKESSCISCHAVSSVKSDGTDGIKFLNTINPVGYPEPLPSSQWIRRDFVWSLFLACPVPPGSSSQACTP